MKITQVEPQKTLRLRSGHGTKRFNIFIDAQFAFGADEDLVVDRRLVVGKEIAEEDLDKIIFDTEVGKLMERIYGLLNVRMRSKKEIRDYLKRLSFKRKLKSEDEISEITIESTIERAINKGLINDEQFAKAWFESRSKKYGINRIKQELIQKGIEREIVEEAISHQPSVIRSEETAEKGLERKIKNWKKLDKMKFRKKAYDFLLRRGFEYETAKTVIEKFIKELYNSN